MPDTAYPTLTEEGWVTHPKTKFRKMLEHYLGNSHSQSHYFKDKVHSLPYLVAKYGNDPNVFSEELSNDLDDYLNAYFDSVGLTTKIKNDSNNVYRIVLGVRVVSDDVSVDMTEIFQVDSNLNRIVRLNNEGVLDG